MGDEPIRFTDGAGYDRFMGVWSRLVGDEFLDWIAPAPGLRWLDVGCGNGAFTERIARRCAPASLHGVDPSEAQLAYAREQPSLKAAHFQEGDAMALPFPADAFDGAVMPLVIFFVPEPARGVAEMARVVAPGGIVAAYAWDMEGGGFPYLGVRAALEEFGVSTPMPPSPEASRPDVLHQLWSAAGLIDLHTRAIEVERTFAGYEELWAILLAGPSAGQALAAMEEAARTRFRERLRERLQPAGGGPITLRARANAIRGLGHPFCRQLQARGDQVVAACRSTSRSTPPACSSAPPPATSSPAPGRS
ncbi:MAG: methyltransferase domain-containing protein [Synechococcaceae cyanobacterium]|nr:methyltransferase domain-containing protein [Synechococcaceae cyanobacterium]